jgi:predicted DCC family thiol-disulfide oxidoreductase YuxK
LRVLPIVKVWYDSSCPLCVREIALMRRLDRRGAIRFTDIQAGLDCPLDASELLARFHAQEGDGPVISGAAAFAAMWRATPPLRPLGLLAQNRVVLWLLERAYRGFLLIRPTLQRVLRHRTTRPDSLPG